MSAEQEPSGGGLAEALQGFSAEFGACWRRLPNKALFLAPLAAWLALFHFLGSSTFGYVDTPSLFGWMLNAYTAPDSPDSHGLLVPLVVLGLFWWKREELLRGPLRTWWPALLLLAVALALHLIGYVVQQARFSIVALFLGIYALMGLAWGPRWLRVGFFPYCLLVFCVPMGSLAEPISFPLRLLVTQIVAGISQGVFGFDVLREGTQLTNVAQHYQYEVAAACSGVRSLIATVAIAIIYAFTTFPKWWQRLGLIAAAFPLAVLGNVVRMMTIVIAAEIGGQQAGTYVHEGGPLGILSLLPYVPAIAGLLVLGRWLERPRAGRAAAAGEAPA